MTGYPTDFYGVKCTSIAYLSSADPPQIALPAFVDFRSPVHYGRQSSRELLAIISMVARVRSLSYVFPRVFVNCTGKRKRGARSKIHAWG